MINETIDPAANIVADTLKRLNELSEKQRRIRASELLENVGPLLDSDYSKGTGLEKVRGTLNTMVSTERSIRRAANLMLAALLVAVTVMGFFSQKHEDRISNYLAFATPLGALLGIVATTILDAMSTRLARELVDVLRVYLTIKQVRISD